MSRRPLTVIAIAGAVALGAAGVSAASWADDGGTAAMHATARTAGRAPMPMQMPMVTTGLRGRLRVALHQRVVRVKIMNFAFQPSRIEVSAGTRVVWTNEDSDPHTVTTDKPAFGSQALDTGQTYAKLLVKAGTFAYHCTIHPFMHGTVIVVGARP